MKRTPVEDQFRYTHGTLVDLVTRSKGLAPLLDKREAEARENLKALGADAKCPESDPEDPTLGRLACDLRVVLFRVQQVRELGLTENGMLEMERLGYACAVAKMRLSEPEIATGAKIRSVYAAKRSKYSTERKLEHAKWQAAINKLRREREGTNKPYGHLALCKAVAKEFQVHPETIKKQTINPNKAVTP